MTVPRLITAAEIEAEMKAHPENWQHWSATPQLRYVERPNPDWCDEPTQIVLQQLWQGSHGSQEWRDVPIVSEE